jgi:hypothetical protein
VDDRRRPGPFSGRLGDVSVPRLLTVVLAIVGVVLAALVVRVGVGFPPASTAPAAGSAVPVPPEPAGSRASRSVERRALRVLHVWDAQRAAAYQSGSGRRLRALYAVGSSAGEADVRLLARYRSRGFTVAGLRTQVLALEVLTSRRGRLRVRVGDRVVGAVAVRGARRVRLPRDAASSRVIDLVRSGDGRWRVSAVRDPTGPG